MLARRPPSPMALLAALAACLMAPAGPAAADVLDPFAFPSLGVLPSNAYLVDTHFGGPLMYTSSGQVLHGVYYGGNYYPNRIAVFDFDSGSATLQVEGDIPVAILSRGDLSVSLTEIGSNNSTTYPNNGLDGGARGGQGGAISATGPIGSFGLEGAYGAGDLLTRLAGGANAYNFNHSGDDLRPLPGSGGAAFEVVASGHLTVGSIDASGAKGIFALFFAGPAGGGGGGGGILLSGDSVTINGLLDASGGYGGGGRTGRYAAGGGGGGGGGEIDILYGPGGFTNHGAFNVSGGPPGYDPSTYRRAQPGANGTVNIFAVPEPSSLVLCGAGSAALTLCTRHRRAARLSRDTGGRPGGLP